MTAILAVLAVLQAGAGVCASPAHAAPPGAAVTGHQAMDEADEACRETHASMGSHGASRSMSNPEPEGPHHTADAGMDCCASGACANCALVTGVLTSSDASHPGIAPMIQAARIPSAPLGRLLAHDPPPPRA